MVDDAGKLVGVLPILRLAEAVVSRVAPEALLTDITDIGDVARFGHAVEARVVRDAMVAAAVIATEATIDEAFRSMHRRHLSGLYVVDELAVRADIWTCSSLSCCTSMRWRRRNRPIRRLTMDLNLVLTAIIFVGTYA